MLHPFAPRRSSGRSSLGTRRAVRALTRWALACAGLVAVAAVTGCPGGAPGNEPGVDGGGGSGGAGGSCPDVPTAIFLNNCGVSGCHSPINPASLLDLVSPGLPARLLGHKGIECATLLIDATSPQKSLLYEKLLPMPPCGHQMPYAGNKLAPEDVQCVLAWITTQVADAADAGTLDGGGDASAD